MLRMKWQRNWRRVGRIGALCLVLALVATLVLPATAYAAQPDAGPCVSSIKILPKTTFGHRDHQQIQVATVNVQQFATITGKLGVLPEGNKRYAIVIGSNYTGSTYTGRQIPFVPPFSFELEYAQADAQAMAGLFTSYRFDKVITLIGDDASRSNILNAIDKIGHLEKAGDEVVFYYSGHGAQSTNAVVGQGGWGRGGGRSVTQQGIVTDEGRGEAVDFLWDYELANAFSNFDTNRLVFIFDSCLSGGMTDLAGQDGIVCMATTNTGIAAEAGEVTLPDGSVIDIEHGLFTYFLLGALSGAFPQAAAYDYGTRVPVVTVEEAYNFASSSLIDITPLIQAALASYYPDRPDIATSWATPTIADLFPQDLLLQALRPRFRGTDAFEGR